MSHSTNRKRATIALTALLLLLLATIFITQYKPAGTDTPASTQVNQIRVHRPSHPDIAMTLLDDTWTITEPVQMLANRQRVEPLLSLASLPTDGYDKSDVDMQASGLLEPVATVILDKQSIAIGNPDISGERRYALHNNQVKFVPEWVLSLVNGGITALAELQLLPSPVNGPMQLVSSDGSSTQTQYDNWAPLSAQQIVLLPMDTSAEALQQYELLDKNRQRLASIIVTTDFVRFQTQPGFAYLLAAETLAGVIPGITGSP